MNFGGEVSGSYVLISDTQCPYEDKKAITAVIRFISECKPDEVVHIGDVMGLPELSSRAGGSRQEFENSALKDAEYR